MASKQGSKWYGVASLVCFNTHRYIILKLLMLLKGALKCYQLCNTSQMKNDAKISNKKKKMMTSSFGIEPPPQCSTEYYKSLKLNLKACDSCWLVIGVHRKKKKHPLGCMTCILYVEHGMKETGHKRWKKQRKCMWQHSEEYNVELVKSKTCY